MKLFVASSLALFSMAANAMSGNELYQLLESENLNDRFRAAGYIEALASSEALFRRVEITLAEMESRQPQLATYSCPPQESELGQYRDIIHNKLRDAPQDRNMDAVIIAHAALTEAWPCL